MKTDKLLWYKFFQEHQCEYHYYDYGTKDVMCIVHMTYFDIEDFIDEIGNPYDDFWEEGGIECKWQGNSFAIDFVPMCEYYEIPIEEIFKKEKE